MNTIYTSFRHVIENDIQLIKYYAMNRDAVDGQTVSTFYQMVSSSEKQYPEINISKDIKDILDYFESSVEGGVLSGIVDLCDLMNALPTILLYNYIRSDTTPENQSVLEYDYTDVQPRRVSIAKAWASYYE